MLIFDMTQRTRKKVSVFPVSGLPNHAVALEQAVVQTRQCQLEALMKASTLELRHEVALPSCRILPSRNSFRCSLPTVEYSSADLLSVFACRCSEWRAISAWQMIRGRR